MAADAFTGADGTALATHDANWTSVSGYSVTTAELSSGIVRGNGAYANYGAYYDGSAVDYSEAVIKAVAGDINKFVTVRAGAATKGYAARFVYSAGAWNAVRVYKDGTQIGYASVPAGSISATADHTLAIGVSGTSTVTIRVWVDGSEQTAYRSSDNGTPLTDASTPIGAGHPGVIVEGNGTQSDSALDDWTDGASAAARRPRRGLMGVGR